VIRKKKNIYTIIYDDILPIFKYMEREDCTSYYCVFTEEGFSIEYYETSILSKHGKLENRQQKASWACRLWEQTKA